MASSITAEEVQKFATGWFRALDMHAPLQTCLEMLAENDLRMCFPDADIRTVGDFRKWYDRVTHLFFDERHTIRNIDFVSVTDGKADVQLVVRWQSGFWEPPAAASQRIDAEVSQKWTVARCSPEKNPFNLEIVDYHVSDDFTYAPGSAVLPASPKQINATFFHVVAKPGKRDALLHFLTWDSEAARWQEPRTIRFDVLPDPERADAFYVFEVYEDADAFAFHQKQAAYLRWISPEVQRDMIAEGGFNKIFEGKPLAIVRRPEALTVPLG